MKIKEIICCDKKLLCPNFTNTCTTCKSDYNWAGQRLASREQWGEETGESAADIFAIDRMSVDECFDNDDY